MIACADSGVIRNKDEGGGMKDEVKRVLGVGKMERGKQNTKPAPKTQTPGP
jgi:hypothetical protein